MDDASPDGTAEEVRRLQAGRPWLKLVERRDGAFLSYGSDQRIGQFGDRRPILMK